MTFVLDASVALRWFVDQPGSDEAAAWLRRFADDPELFVGPDLLRFEVHGGLARLQAARDADWAPTAFARFDRLGIRTLPTTAPLFARALNLSRELSVAGYDAVYLAHAEALSVPWLTADRRVLRRLARDPRVRALEAS
jgi:predicted nucleic acid-binding protein